MSASATPDLNADGVVFVVRVIFTNRAASSGSNELTNTSACRAITTSNSSVHTKIEQVLAHRGSQREQLSSDTLLGVLRWKCGAYIAVDPGFCRPGAGSPSYLVVLGRTGNAAGGKLGRRDMC